MTAYVCVFRVCNMCYQNVRNVQQKYPLTVQPNNRKMCKEMNHLSIICFNEPGVKIISSGLAYAEQIADLENYRPYLYPYESFSCYVGKG